jgi:hypothetical protein
MPRAQHKYHFIYKTTNLKNGKFYIGMHSTSNLDDGYLGSGDRLRRSLRKHSKENFKLEILEFFECREALVKREKELVNEDILKDPMCMNLKPGGSGGFVDEKHAKKFHIAGAYKVNNTIWKNPECLEKASKRVKKLWEIGVLKYKDNWTGKKHTEETKQKIKNTKINTGLKEKNSQFGTMWITNGIKNKKIKKDLEIPENWYKGMIAHANSLKNLKRSTQRIRR